MIAIIDVSGNNLASVVNAVKRLGYAAELTHQPKKLAAASHIILPGVGTAARGMAALKQYNLIEPLRATSKPLLGICLGMQLLLDYSEEGNVPCLGMIPGFAKRLTPQANMPVPHMGWNSLEWIKTCPLARGLKTKSWMYFVHSYALPVTQNTLATCSYSENFSAVINKDHIYGMQFHPEKSSDEGLTLLKNFLELT